MSVHVLEPHDSYAALKPVRLAWYGAPLRATSHTLPFDRTPPAERTPTAAPRT
jgi:hypothetical protein